MCDLTQFIIFSITIDTESKSLAKLFMREVVLSLGMVEVVVVDAYSRFRDAFEAMCKYLQISLCTL